MKLADALLVSAYPEFVQLPLLLENLPVSLDQLALQTPHLGFQQRVFVH